MHHKLVARAYPVIVFVISTLAVACVPTMRPRQPAGPPTEQTKSSASPSVRPSTSGVEVDAEEAVDFGSDLQRDALVAAVVRRNPGVDAAREAWKAALARPAQVGSLDDPMFSYAFAPASIGSNRVDYGENVEISQRLPWPGKLRLKSEAAEGDAEAMFQDLEEAKLRIALKASALFDEYYLVARTLELNAEHVRLLEELRASAAAQYATGALSQQDAVHAEVELAHLAHQEVVTHAERRVIVARLNALLHRPPAATLPPPPAHLTAGEHIEDLLGLAESQLTRLETVAVERRPEITAAEADIRARTAEVSLAWLETFPDFGVMGQYNSMWGDEEHRWMAGFEMNLPIWRQRIRAARAEADARLAVAKRKRQAMEDEVRAELRESYERLVEAHHILHLYESRLLPAANDHLRVSRAGLESGQASFISLIETERSLRDAQLGYHEALATLHKRIAEFSRQLGCMPADLAPVLESLETTDGGLAAADGGAR